MNDHESADILAILAAAWPNQEITRETAQLWLGMLAELDPDDAMAGARTVVRNEHWFPSIARFRQATDAARHARRNQEAAARGLPRPGGRIPDEERFQAIIAGLRDNLADRGTRTHWHGGPHPCHVCGGIAPPKPPTAARHATQPQTQA